MKVRYMLAVHQSMCQNRINNAFLEFLFYFRLNVSDICLRILKCELDLLDASEVLFSMTKLSIYTNIFIGGMND